MADLDLTPGIPNVSPYERVEPSDHSNQNQSGKKPKFSSLDKKDREKKKQNKPIETKDQISISQVTPKVSNLEAVTKQQEPPEKGKIIDIKI